MRSITRQFPYILAAVGIAAAAEAGRGELVYGTTQAGFLVSWDSATPGTVIGGVPISGLSSNESLVGIDFRPATGVMYGLGSFSRLYTINQATGLATPVGAAFTPGINGSHFGFDFNPVADRIRVTSNADQNIRLNPGTGLVAASDPNLAYGAGDPGAGSDPDITHVAYTNSFAGATSTLLYGIDTDRDVLTLHTVAPGFATVTTVGAVGADLTETGGFDISGLTGVAYATVLNVSLNRSTFWTINLATGQGAMVGMVGQVGGGEIITSMTVTPSPSSLALLGLGGLCGLRRRR